MSALYDITPPITENLAVWPGDTPPQREVLQEISRGDAVTLSTLRATVHLGAHADGPNHYGIHGRAIDKQPLELYLGRCRLVRADVPRGERVGPGHLSVSLVAIDAPRVLIATGTFPDWGAFNEDFAGLSPQLIDALHERGVRLIGTDAPSVDIFDSKDLPAHKRCLAHDIAIIEGLLLQDVPEGEYELIALPLRLAGFDGSPIRAVLRRLTAPRR